MYKEVYTHNVKKKAMHKNNRHIPKFQRNYNNKKQAI